MKLSAGGWFLLALFLGLYAPAPSIAEVSHGVGAAGRPIADPNAAVTSLANVLSSCFAGRPGDVSSIPSAGGGTVIQSSGGVPTPLPSLPSGGGATASTVKTGPASIDTVRNFVSAKCQKCHSTPVTLEGTTFSDARIVKNGKSYTFKDVVDAMNTVEKMKTGVPAAVKQQLQAWADAQ